MKLYSPGVTTTEREMFMGTSPQATKLRTPLQNPGSWGYLGILRQRRSGYPICALSLLSLHDRDVVYTPDSERRPNETSKKETTRKQGRVQPSSAKRTNLDTLRLVQTSFCATFHFQFTFLFCFPLFFTVSTEHHHARFSTHVLQSHFTQSFSDKA